MIIRIANLPESLPEVSPPPGEIMARGVRSPPGPAPFSMGSIKLDSGGAGFSFDGRS